MFIKKYELFKSAFFLFLFFLFIFSFSIYNSVKAEVTTPLYTVDYKSQVIFGDSVTVGSYKGLENYTADYALGYLHIKYTTTHYNGNSAMYPPFLYVRSGDPSHVSNTTSLYLGLSKPINNGPGYPTDVYFIDIQFSAVGYREVVTRGAGATPVSDDTIIIANMNSDTFVALANNYSLSASPYSMSFAPMRLVFIAPSEIISFDVSTSTRTVTVHDFISSNDSGAGINFSIEAMTQTDVYTADTVYATTTGDFYYTWSYPDITEPKTTKPTDFTFYTDIKKDSTVLKSTNKTVTLSSSIDLFNAFYNFTSDARQSIGSSYNYFIQSLGTGMSGTLTQIDLQTSNPGFASYGSRPGVTLYECSNSKYGSTTFDGVGCNTIFSGVSDSLSQLGTSTQSLYTGDIVLDSSKYYFLRTSGNNQLNALPTYYGSAVDAVDGSCFEYKQSQNTTTPCASVSDLYFYLRGVIKNITPPPDPIIPEPTYSSVLFLPGYESSRLYKTGVINCQINCEDQLWEPNANSDAEDLYLNDDGTSRDDSIYTRDVMDEVYGTLNVYKTFLQKLEEMKTTDGTIADYSAVPYDWRLSLEDILNRGTKTGENISYTSASDDPYIISELRRLAEGSDTGKVTIVAHSNGGLLTKALLKKLADTNDPLLQKIDKVILVAVPQLGTPMAITAMLHGYKQGISAKVYTALSDNVARELGHNSISAYNLIPSSNYFTYVDNPVVKFDDSMPDWISRYGETIHSQELLHNFLTDSYGRVESLSTETDTPIQLSDSFLTRAETEHSALDNVTIPSGIALFEIAGWGIPTTVSGVEYYKDDGQIKINPIWTIDGDATVVTPSALWSGGATSTRYWVDLKQYNKDHRIGTFGGFLPLNHPNILEVDELQTTIKNIILATSTDSLPEYISTSTPIAGANDTRLIYALHSPLTLDIYDDLGNHTGISTSTNKLEEQIPGTYYIQLGEVKYIFTNTGSPLHVSMSGYDTGMFTFSISQMQGDNVVSKVEFKDVPSTPTTRVSMTVENDINTLSDLRVDSLGSGIADIILKPIIGQTVTYTPPVSSEPETEDEQDPVSEPEQSETPVAGSNQSQTSGGNGPVVSQKQISIDTKSQIILTKNLQNDFDSVSTSSDKNPVQQINFDKPNTETEGVVSVTNVTQKSVENTKVEKQTNIKYNELGAQVISADRGYSAKILNLLKEIYYWFADIFNLE